MQETSTSVTGGDGGDDNKNKDRITNGEMVCDNSDCREGKEIVEERQREGGFVLMRNEN